MKKTLVLLLLSLLILSAGCSRPTPAGPPTLTVNVNGSDFEIQSHAFKWTVVLKNGQAHTSTTASEHPLNIDHEPIETDADRVNLSWPDNPETSKLVCWPNGSAPDDEPFEVLMDDLCFTPLKGSYIYQLSCEWDNDDHYGTADYAFQIIAN
ncbi:MAG: hypothetical protein IJO95_04845 [Clostridia bacterium]|nr:hypothetical protein [Clostridia bacterium]